MGNKSLITAAITAIEKDEPDDVVNEAFARAANMAVAGNVIFAIKYKGRDYGIIEYENGYQVDICKTKHGFSLTGRQR